jgi:hypothetical protein
MSCKNCGENYPIINKWFGLCRGCNNERLHGSKHGKVSKPIEKKRKSNSDVKNKPKQKNKSIAYLMSVGGKEKPKKKTMYEKDNDFYKECFKTFNNKCDECGCKQPEEFLNSNGKVNARYRYSHIVPKSIAPELRHEIENINDLCLKCHSKWEGEKKIEMGIYKTNSKKDILKKFF